MTRRAPGLCAGLTLSVFTFGPAYAQSLDDVVGGQVVTQRAAAASQKKIDKIADQTETLIDQYREVLRRTESLRIYNKQLQKLIDSQGVEIGSLGQQIEDVTVVARDIRPLMLSMIETLGQFVELDVPFLIEERRERVAFLESLMARSDVTDAERYRRVLEAYQVESDYGRNIEAYEGDLDVGGETRTVNFLSIGRVTLIYQTKDGAESGVWDNENRQWVDLGGGYRSSIRDAFRIARKQRAPDMLTLPVPAPKGAGE